MTDDHTTVLDVPEGSRFEVRVDGAAAGRAEYSVVPGAIRFTHTEIDDAYSGRGLGGTLVRGALDAARSRRLAVLPECRFVRGWIEKHPDYVDLVPADQRARFGL
ncbi:MAG TPA: GNAT family N-acetyltransferase [Pseudonocardia sp.]|nr:GNAT family N-acetyltransferase [Pseudonocardia sp.]